MKHLKDILSGILDIVTSLTHTLKLKIPSKPFGAQFLPNALIDLLDLKNTIRPQDLASIRRLTTRKLMI